MFSQAQSQEEEEEVAAEDKDHFFIWKAKNCQWDTFGSFVVTKIRKRER